MEESKYEIGEEVEVRDDLRVGFIYGEDTFSKNMGKTRGRIAIITHITISGAYRLDILPHYNFTDEMLIKPVDELANLPYFKNSAVEELIEFSLKKVPKQLIDYALDNGDKEMFNRLVGKDGKTEV